MFAYVNATAHAIGSLTNNFNPSIFSISRANLFAALNNFSALSLNSFLPLFNKQAHELLNNPPLPEPRNVELAYNPPGQST